MAFKIYTKTGDKGETGLFGGKRLPKNHIRIEAYGTVDELNSFIGVVRDSVQEKQTRFILKEVQDRLFNIGANLASDPEKNMATPDILESDIELLEQEIDRLNEELPDLKHFILPGGHVAVSHCHVARCVCRRAERRVIELDQSESVEPILVKFLNRLSDYLFVLSRKIGMDLGVEEVKWEPRKK
jgi:cob(I)alamin adenosyltransferase